MQDKGNSQHIVKQRNKRCWLTYLAFFSKVGAGTKVGIVARMQTGIRRATIQPSHRRLSDNGGPVGLGPQIR